MALLKDYFFLIIAYFSFITVINCDDPEIGEKCVHTELDQHCYTLYGSQTSSVTWSDARAQCEGHGKQLVAITSSNVQDTIIELIQPIKDTTGTVHVWTSGIKSENKNWFQVNNVSVPQEVLDKFKYGAQPDRCGVILDVSGDKPLDSKQCDERKDRYLCQGPSPCESNEVSYNGFCYGVYSETQIDWNQARQLCRNKSNRDLAYLHVTDTDLLSKFESLKYTWIGLASRNWIWDSDGSRMVYTKFRGGVLSDSCVFVDANDGGKWAVDNCEGSNKYFVCEKTADATITTTITTVTTTATDKTTTLTTTSSTTSLSPAATSTTNNSLVTDENIYGIPREYVIIATSVGVPSLIIIVMVVCAVLWKKRKSGKIEALYNDYIYGRAVGQQDNTYSEMPAYPNGNNEYGEIGEITEQLNSSDVPRGYKRSPQGDLYALPRKNDTGSAPQDPSP